MRWPIRNQILLPFLTIQIVTVTAVAVASAWIAVRQVEDEITVRLDRVLSTLESATYPLTPAVLGQLQQLSGAEFAVLDDAGQLQDATFDETRGLSSELSRQSWQSLDSDIVVNRSLRTIGGERYFAGRVRLRAGNSEQSVLVLYPERSWDLARWEAMFPPLAIAGGLLLLTVAVSLVIARRIGGRIHAVERQVSRIAGGDFHPVPVLSVDDELSDLAEGVNRMAAVMDDSLRSVRERERSAMLTQLVGGLAHQLRNALTGARTSVQLHRRHCATSDDEAIDVALQQLTLTEEQIKALLRLTRGETRAPASAGVDAVLDETVALVRPICEHKKIAFAYERGDVAGRVSDSDAMRGALLNLVMNAIEAAGPSGSVSVRARTESGGVTIDVADDGPGVPEDIADDVFAPFFTTKEEGAGLGLALARKAALDCGGTLTLHRLDGLTVFRLTLPSEHATNEVPAVSVEQAI